MVYHVSHLDILSKYSYKTIGGNWLIPQTEAASYKLIEVHALSKKNN
jgi:hypothetical protein